MNIYGIYTLDEVQENDIVQSKEWYNQIFETGLGGGFFWYSGNRRIKKDEYIGYYVLQIVK